MTRPKKTSKPAVKAAANAARPARARPARASEPKVGGPAGGLVNHETRSVRRSTAGARAVPAAKRSRPAKPPPVPSGPQVAGDPSPESAGTPPTKRQRVGLAPEPAVVAQIRELEAQLDRLIDEASRRDLSALDTEDDVDDDADDADAAQRAADDAAFDAEDTVPSALPRPNGPAHQASFHADTRPSATLPELRSSGAFGDLRGGVPAPPESVFDTARELLSTDFYLRKWGRLAMRGRSEEVDDFGLDPIYDAKLKPLLDFLYKTYFRVETSGIESVPKTGRCLLVANHSGTVPLDGVMIKAAVKREHSAPRDVRWLTEDFIYHFPFLGSAMNRLGAVRACQENAERLLNKEQLVAVFPEGVKGIGKLFGERYRLQRFGRGGFIKLCLRTSTPIVPVAVIGAEETNPMLFKLEHLSKALGVPYVPVTPTFPLLGPLGLLPAPTKWRILFGEPLDLSSHGPEAADDEILVGKLAERVRATIQGMVDRAVGSRKSVFFG